jgi:ferritin-like metal-binding protein YciE
MVDEGDAILEEFANTDAADAAVAQATEHYEINRFGAYYEWVRELGRLDAARLLSGILVRMRVVA